MLTMIRLLTSEDYETVEEFLDKDHINNIYIIHALQAYGLESKIAKFWGSFEGSHLSGVLYSENVANVRQGSLCGEGRKSLTQLGASAVKAEIDVLVGKEEYLMPILNKYSHRFEIEGRYDFNRANTNHLKARYDYPVKFATNDDVALLVELYKNSELGDTRNRKRGDIEKEIRRTLQYESGFFFVEQNGRAISASNIIAETDKYGMVDGATTLHEFRRRGIYQSVRTACNEYLLNKNKIGLSIISEKDANVQSFSKKVKNESIGKWLILVTKKKPGFKKTTKQKLRFVKNWIKLSFKNDDNCI